MLIREFTQRHGAGRKPASKPSPQAHNVGNCGGGCGGSGGACRCGPGPFVPPNGDWKYDPRTGQPTRPEPNTTPAGMAAQAQAIMAAAGIDPSQPITSTTYAQALAIIGQLPTLRPPGARFDRNAWASYAQSQAANVTCVPYEDAIKDCIMMDEIETPVTVVGAGLSVTLELAPDNGWFDLYYTDLAVFTAAGVPVAPEAVLLSRGTVLGCPLPPCSTGNARSGRFAQALDGCCCGRPTRAIIGPETLGNPYILTVTNITAAAVSVQLLGRGFCSDMRVCV